MTCVWSIYLVDTAISHGTWAQFHDSLSPHEGCDYAAQVQAWFSAKACRNSGIASPCRQVPIHLQARIMLFGYAALWLQKPTPLNRGSIEKGSGTRLQVQSLVVNGIGC